MTHDNIRLLGPADVRELAARLDVHPTKKLGQNFVIDPNTIRKIVAAADLMLADKVVEVGPGLGSLTLGILETGASLVAIEIDPRLAGQLPATIAQFAPGCSVPVVCADALTVDELSFDGVPVEPTAIVANLPYNVAVPVLLHMLATFPSLQRGLVMVQSEVADRVAAAPGSKVYGVPSVKARWYGTWRTVGKVGRHVFWPAPNVDSALLRFDASERPGDDTLRSGTFAAIDAAFGNRRKTLRQALSSWAGSPAEAEAVLVAAGIDPRERAEQLTLDDFVAIARSARE